MSAGLRDQFPAGEASVTDALGMSLLCKLPYYGRLSGQIPTGVGWPGRFMTRLTWDAQALPALRSWQNVETRGFVNRIHESFYSRFHLISTGFSLLCPIRRWVQVRSTYYPIPLLRPLHSSTNICLYMYLPLIHSNICSQHSIPQNSNPCPGPTISLVLHNPIHPLPQAPAC